MDEERLRLYQAWRAATEEYWQLLFRPAGCSLEEAKPVIEKMNQTLHDLMKHAGHSRI